MGGRVRWLAATPTRFVRWLRDAAGWAYGANGCLLEGYLVNEQVEWSLRNETKRNEVRWHGCRT